MIRNVHSNLLESNGIDQMVDEPKRFDTIHRLCHIRTRYAEKTTKTSEDSQENNKKKQRYIDQ